MIFTRTLLAAIALGVLATMAGGPAVGQEQAEEDSSREAELKRLESGWIENRNKAQLVSNQIRKFLEQHDLDSETFDLEFEAEREWWLSLRLRYREADLEWKIVKARMEHFAKDDGAVEEEELDVQREIEEVRAEIRRAQAEGVGPTRPELRELEARAKFLEDHLAGVRRRHVEHLQSELGELDAVRRVLKAEFDAADAKLRMLGRVKSRLDAYREQHERYAESANRLYRQWESLQSE